MVSQINDLNSLIQGLADKIETHLINIRRDIHAYPETAFEEVRTASIVSKELTTLGIDHQTGIGGTGVLGFIRGGVSGANTCYPCRYGCLTN